MHNINKNLYFYKKKRKKNKNPHKNIKTDNQVRDHMC